MTYSLIIVPFAVITMVVVLLTVRLPGFGRRMTASVFAAGILVALTAVFDNAMIAAGLFTYPETLISGVRIGLAPIEDLAYPVCAAFLVPAVFTLLTGSRAGQEVRS
ncbi:lycopene cyclase domain-containing protein [Microbacterium trichothecenolyticum]|uniref:lycopene cyclase domain-containing protein n=1 Tax=Microbacterium trichothecenolyticum TaxID=69370 RepID=UPI001C6ECA42|nr:lycopene cyclase domain-containing protein [Microbacterium trichothecenolyticum]MBW9118506.1 lycopene cyclase domain-containing protein [Microbacterium trichothecenolyticum]